MTDLLRQEIAASATSIVVKVGTRVLTREDGRLNEERIAQLARARGLEPLVEVHDPGEIPFAQSARARMVGWNARDLADFSVRKAPAALLREAFPEALLIRESGIRTPEDAGAALGEGFDALLIGEALMRETDPAGFLARIPVRP